ncbi:hypothetical protein [Paenarthrobacter sp. NPDC089316]|uniref:hypothetical protein n=1 Tax=unclassified Paenarthrobacter TaxID=2634190 RepID=UPI0034358BD7
MSASDRLDVIGEGLVLLGERIAALAESVERLERAKEVSGAAALNVICTEEAAKVLILLDMARIPHSQEMLNAACGYFYDHLARSIYARVHSGNPDHFGETARYIEIMRASHYLDGPAGADWIFRNDLQRERDTALYVDYEEVEPGKFSWTGGHLEYLSSHQPVTDLVLAMKTSGLLTPDGIRVVDDIWKGIRFDNSSRWDVCWNLNRKILNELFNKDAKVVEPADREEFKLARTKAGEIVAQGWTFPLLHLDLTIEYVRQEEIQEAQRASYQQWLQDEFGPFY